MTATANEDDLIILHAFRFATAICIVPLPIIHISPLSALTFTLNPPFPRGISIRYFLLT